jgi:predicted metal-dependent enzyme (double-stranded beta helix superfamily)
MKHEIHFDPEVFGVEGLVCALRDARASASGERDMLRRVRAIARRASERRNDWLRPEMCEPDAEQGFGMYVLHEEHDHQLAVFVVSWLPGSGTPPHDHGTWAVVVGIEGVERNTFWKRLDDGTSPGLAEIARIGERHCHIGDVVALPNGAIHSVHNDTDRVSVSLHIYGRHVNHTRRSRFDPAQRTAVPYRVTTSGATALTHRGDQS